MTGTEAFWARCGACGHCWSAAWLPMAVATLARVLTTALCPKCGGDRILVARQKNGVLLEARADTDPPTTKKETASPCRS